MLNVWPRTGPRWRSSRMTRRHGSATWIA